ncbi:MAG TPA: hypothetical protein VM661_01960 [Candidatus Sulfotelmatobacter sp.]|jgi:hypothetical protein|nr:hypothetical protein [Candidatus Sulfotelmatobacter sp.]
MTDDLELALILASLFRDTKAKPRGTLLWPSQRDRLAADKALAAYFASVAEAGAEGWKEEMDRMRGRLTEMPPEQRGDPMNVYAIRAMLPMWRKWGEVVANSPR